MSAVVTPAPLPSAESITVPFSALFPSPSNVRSGKTVSESGVRQLAALIEAACHELTSTRQGH
jgi:hypothetical protein